MNPNFPDGLDIYPSAPPAIGLIDSGIDKFEQEGSIEKYGIAGRIWEAAYAMIYYVTRAPGWEFDPPFPLWSSAGPLTIVELGAGTGIVSLRLAEALSEREAGDVVVMTDLVDVCPLLEQNVVKYTRRGIGSVDLRVHPLAWGNDQHARELLHSLSLSNHDQPHGVTHIICSDLVYFPSLLAPLLRSLLTLTTLSDIPPNVIISYKIRSLVKETLFWSAFGLWFTYEPVLVRRASCTGGTSGDASGEWERLGASWDGPTFVLVARRRKESLRWDIPDDDAKLLAGVGAQGTSSRKGDGTFENLLFMQMQDF